MEDGTYVPHMPPKNLRSMKRVEEEERDRREINIYCELVYAQR